MAKKEMEKSPGKIVRENHEAVTDGEFFRGHWESGKSIIC